jgi:hypothetical protein
VVLLTAEDGLADTVRPRFDAMGGDPNAVYVLKGIREGEKEKAFILERDIPALEDAIVTHKAILVVIDPLSAYLGRIDSHKDPEVRSLLSPLAALAERTNVAILGIMHLSKDDDRKALYRLLGSQAFVAAARSVLILARDEKDPDRRLFLILKLNLAAKRSGIGFRIREAANGSSHVEWDDDPVTVDADTALTGTRPEERVEREDAISFLEDLLADGPVSVRDVFSQSRRNGISDRTLRRAKEDLSVISDHEGWPGQQQDWYWKLPEAPEVASLGEDSVANAVSTDTSPKVASSKEAASLEEARETKGKTAHFSPKGASGRGVEVFEDDPFPMHTKTAFDTECRKPTTKPTRESKRKRSKR